MHQNLQELIIYELDDYFSNDEYVIKEIESFNDETTYQLIFTRDDINDIELMVNDDGVFVNLHEDVYEEVDIWSSSVRYLWMALLWRDPK